MLTSNDLATLDEDQDQETESFVWENVWKNEWGAKVTGKQKKERGI